MNGTLGENYILKIFTNDMMEITEMFLPTIVFEKVSLNKFAKVVRKTRAEEIRLKAPAKLHWAIFTKSKNGRYKLVVCSPNFKKQEKK